MKPKLVENHEQSNSNNNNNMNSAVPVSAPPQQRSEPGRQLRINQPPVPGSGIKSPVEVKSILRTSNSLDRSRRSSAESTSSSLSMPKRNSSVDAKPHSLELQMNPAATLPKTEIKPKSILVKKKVPKLVHTPASNEAGEKESQGPKIYAQSATDISAGEDDDSERQRKASIPLTINTKARFLEVPQNPEQGAGQEQRTNGKLRKSKSFASSGSEHTGQYEYAMKDSEISAKQKTIMAFFDASLTAAGSNNQSGNINPQRKSMLSPPMMQRQAVSILETTAAGRSPAGQQVQLPNQQSQTLANNNQLQQVKQTADTSTLQSAVVKRSSAMAIHAKRGSITSISDEILGDDDLKDVDAVFESLLNSTFQEIQARGRSADSGASSKKKRSASVHPTSRVSFSSAESNITGNVPRSESRDLKSSSNIATVAESSGGGGGVSSSSGPKRGTVNRKQSKHKLVAGEVKSAVIVNNSDLTTTPGSGSNTTNTMPNKEVLADPLAALPTSHTKKYLPRQQTWAGGSEGGPPSPNLTLPQTPSPTQSEYDTCPDPWEDY